VPRLITTTNAPLAPLGEASKSAGALVRLTMQHRCLAVLPEFMEDAISVSEVAKRTGLTLPNTSRMLCAMYFKGVISARYERAGNGARRPLYFARYNSLGIHGGR
jgi:predicted transcriptional regulator